MGTRQLIFTVIAICLAIPQLHAQSGKAFFKEGEKLREAQQFEPAIEKYTFAIRTEPGMIKAYQARAEVYGLLGKQREQAIDLGQVAKLDPSEPDNAVAAADAFLAIDSAARSLAFCEQALLVAPKNQQALITKTKACLELGDLDGATKSSDEALAIKATTDTYFLHGLVRTATRDYKTAEFDLDKVLEWNHLYEPAYVALSEVQLFLYEQYSGSTMKARTVDKAIEKCTRALELNPQSTDALFVRSKAFGLQKEYAKAIDDISRCLALGRQDRDVYLQRARYYQGYGQFQNAINDVNHVVLADPQDMEALQLRASCKESNLDLEGALKDVDALQKAMETAGTLDVEKKREIEATKVRIAQQVFEMNRETDAPSITVIEPFRSGDVAQVSNSIAFAKVSGHVRDKSLLKSITVNGAKADYSADEKDPEFVVSIPLAADVTEINVIATDVYGNFSSEVLKVERSEGVAPTIAVTSPSTSGDKQITLDAGKNEVFVEGTVKDASLIRLIAVNGVNASYVPDVKDPDFSIRVDLGGKDQFTLRAEDQFGNATEQVYTVMRKAAAIAVVKPPPPDDGTTKPVNTAPRTGSTGTTWVIYIENTDYRNLPAPQGGSGDMADLQKTFGKYNAQKTITKKNLTKAQIERFFNIELRDLVRTNKVNTVVVGYVGHGRSAGGRTYWVPVDGKRDDIYSYFNYGSLKSLLENYSESVSNTLVVSRAAGTDPSFYELTR
ncbi:MAG TPA: tetratricopeptide repeat protein [Flavobacteriales bacterium]|nr:tetratricopeptide repeat protein [Flavobacteriales bacterium]